MNFNIIICGVGGQGIVVASRLIAITAMNKGYTVSTAETLGMSQREGSVVSHLRFGDEIKGSLIPNGSADLIIGFEPSEVLRNIKYLKKNGKIIMNSRAVVPSAKTSESHYDVEKIVSLIVDSIKSAICTDFTKIAENSGNSKALNVSMLGAAFYGKFLPLGFEDFLKTLNNEIPKKYLSLNLKAAELGAQEISKFLEGQNEC